MSLKICLVFLYGHFLYGKNINTVTFCTVNIPTGTFGTVTSHFLFSTFTPDSAVPYSAEPRKTNCESEKYRKAVLFFVIPWCPWPWCHCHICVVSNYTLTLCQRRQRHTICDFNTLKIFTNLFISKAFKIQYVNLRFLGINTVI